MAAGAAWLRAALVSSRRHVPLHQLWNRLVDLSLRQVCSASCSQLLGCSAGMAQSRLAHRERTLASPLAWVRGCCMQLPRVCAAQFQGAPHRPEAMMMCPRWPARVRLTACQTEGSTVLRFQPVASELGSRAL